MNVKELQQQAIEKCFHSKSTEHMDIMKEMIEVAYREGRKQGHKEMSKVARENLANLIPDSLYLY